jgi:hypothetical protein
VLAVGQFGICGLGVFRRLERRNVVTYPFLRSPESESPTGTTQRAQERAEGQSSPQPSRLLGWL